MNNIKTYCPLPWIGRNILPSSIQPCCVWHGIGDPLDNAEPLGYSPTFQNARKLMLKGEKVKGCKQCYVDEESGIKSKRLQELERFGIVDKIENKILDISFDNVCNLKCRGCTSGNSHLWIDDEKVIYGQTFFNSKYLENNLEIDLSTVKFIGVSGGEPFLSKKFDAFAEKLIYDDLEIDICTNGTIKPSNTIYKLLLNCKSLYLQVSIDGIGHLNSYFRSRSNFKDCENNLNFFRNLLKLRQNRKTCLTIHTTVSIYNVNLVKEIERYISLTYPEYYFTHRNLYYPPQLSIRHLPQDYKKILIPIVENFGESYKDIVYELTSTHENYFDHFLNFHNELDKLRNESLQESNPLLSEFISRYPKKIIDSKVFFIEQMNKIKCGM